jgi:biopolymer transport protein ExbD
MIKRRQRRERADNGAFDTINITPFTDVLLVLLIIFMIAGSSLAPTGLGLSGIASGEATSEPLPTERPLLLVEIDRDGTTRLSYRDESLLWSELQELPRGTQATLSIDPTTPAEQVVRQYDRLLDSGLRDIEWAPPREP